MDQNYYQSYAHHYGPPPKKPTDVGGRIDPYDLYAQINERRLRGGQETTSASSVPDEPAEDHGPSQVEPHEAHGDEPSEQVLAGGGDIDEDFDEGIDDEDFPDVDPSEVSGIVVPAQSSYEVPSERSLATKADARHDQEADEKRFDPSEEAPQGLRDLFNGGEDEADASSHKESGGVEQVTKSARKSKGASHEVPVTYLKSFPKSLADYAKLQVRGAKNLNDATAALLASHVGFYEGLTAEQQQLAKQVDKDDPLSSMKADMARMRKMLLAFSEHMSYLELVTTMLLADRFDLLGSPPRCIEDVKLTSRTMREIYDALSKQNHEFVEYLKRDNGRPYR